MLCSLFKAHKRFPLSVIIKRKKSYHSKICSSAYDTQGPTTCARGQRWRMSEPQHFTITLQHGGKHQSTKSPQDRTHTAVRSEAGHRQHYKGSTIILLGNGTEKVDALRGKKQTRINGSNRFQDVTQSESRSKSKLLTFNSYHLRTVLHIAHALQSPNTFHHSPEADAQI